ncbi:MAG: cobalamin-dependent protein [Anaerolineales bacterium]|nr:cobalamin-dependent protein [Anaerolineales bacterium]
MATFDEIKEKMAEALVEGDEESAAVIAQQALDDNIGPTRIFKEIITPVLTQIGERFGRLEIFLPEVLLSADAAKAVFLVLKPVIEEQKVEDSHLGKVVIGTMSGDVHEIGKDIVAIMLEVNGFEVNNLGRDVSVDTLLNTARQDGAQIIAMSSLLTTSLPYMKDMINMLKETGQNNMFKTLVGGGPVTSEWAASIGADGYGKDASEAVLVAKKLVGAA